MPSLKDFVDAMNASWPVALTIFMACAGILISDYAEFRYIAGLPPWVPSAAFIAAIFSGSVVIVRLLQATISAIEAPFRRRKWQATLQSHLAKLDELPQNEAAVLVWAIASRNQVIVANFNEPRLLPLVAKGYLDRLGGTHSILEWPFRIPDHVWDELMRQWKEEPFEVPQDMQNPFLSRW
jgi:hypothetical protein